MKEQNDKEFTVIGFYDGETRQTGYVAIKRAPSGIAARLQAQADEEKNGRDNLVVIAVYEGARYNRLDSDF